MLVIFPFMVGSRRKLFAWCILFAAGLIEGAGRAESIWLFVSADALAGCLLAFGSRHLAYKAISLIFVAMLCIHGGTLARILVSGSADLYAYASMERALGWGQLAILAAWGGMDAARYGIACSLRIFRHAYHAGGVR